MAVRCKWKCSVCGHQVCFMKTSAVCFAWQVDLISSVRIFWCFLHGEPRRLCKSKLGDNNGTPGIKTLGKYYMQLRLRLAAANLEKMRNLPLLQGPWQADETFTHAARKFHQGAVRNQNRAFSMVTRIHAVGILYELRSYVSQIWKPVSVGT